MTKYTINGGYVLRGEVMICGAKNAVLPVLSATLINKGVSRIINCPDISDVRITMDILKDLGCKVKFIKKSPGNIIEVDATEVNKSKIDAGKACLCRSSVTFLGALTARLNEAEVAYPGGCTIGERPIDIHETAMREMGIETTLNNTHIKTKVCRNDCNTEPIKNIYLKFPSVGATENAMMAAAGLEENVIIYGAATEPEILCLGNYLKALGVKIQGLGTGCIKIKGQKEYSKENLIFRIIPDRIEASTYFTGRIVISLDANCSFAAAFLDIMIIFGLSLIKSSISFILDEKGILASTTSNTTSIKSNFSPISLLVLAI